MFPIWCIASVISYNLFRVHSYFVIKYEDTPRQIMTWWQRLITSKPIDVIVLGLYLFSFAWLLLGPAMLAEVWIAGLRIGRRDREARKRQERIWALEDELGRKP